MLSLMACYFSLRRSVLNIYTYLVNDFVLFTLWLVPVVQGQSSAISVLVLPTLLIINDTYGVYNWHRIAKKQKLNKMEQKNIIITE